MTTPHWGSLVDDDAVLDVMAETITADWDVTPGYAKELARQLVMSLKEKGVEWTSTHTPPKQG